MSRRLVLLLFAVLSLAVVDNGTSKAQSPVAPGDFYWQLTYRGVMTDTRMQFAFALLIDTDAARAMAHVEGAMVHANPEVARFIQEKSRAEAELLLAASGFADPEQDLVQTRACRYWAPEVLDAPVVAASLAAEIDHVLGELGVEGPTCKATSTSDEADLIVWPFGFNSEPTSVNPRPDSDSFITPASQVSTMPPATGGSDVSPPVTGSGGLIDTATP